MNYLTTREVVAKLGINEDKLRSMIRSGKIPCPNKNASDCYVWTDDDIEIIREVLQRQQERKAKPAA